MNKSLPKHDAAIIYTDGGARGNPGPAAIGVVLKSLQGEQLSQISKTIGIATNNVAEYLAVIYGLQEAILLDIRTVTVMTDSQLIARQLKGKYRVKDQSLKKFCDIALNLFRGFDKVSIEEIPRELNTEADSLVNQALDQVSLL